MARDSEQPSTLMLIFKKNTAGKDIDKVGKKAPGGSNPLVCAKSP